MHILWVLVNLLNFFKQLWIYLLCISESIGTQTWDVKSASIGVGFF